MTCATEGCGNRASHVCDVEEGMSLILCEGCALFVKESGYHAWRVR